LAVILTWPPTAHRYSPPYRVSRSLCGELGEKTLQLAVAQVEKNRKTQGFWEKHSAMGFFKFFVPFRSSENPRKKNEELEDWQKLKAF
jgi:hypothetical protein